MRAEDFAAWLSAISGMNEGQRTEAIAALEKASAVGAKGGASAKKDGKHGRQEDVLRTTSVERVAAQGYPHCAGRRSSDADGASAQEGEMARSRQSDDRGQEPGEDRGALRRSSDDGLPLATSVSARASCQQATKLSGIVEADETFVRTIFQFSSPATGRVRPSTRSCLRSTGLSIGRALAGVDRRRRPANRLAAAWAS
jgi:hypothetical protein